MLKPLLGVAVSPIFNNKGKVIGINYGVFPGFRGSNFGVPVSYGIDLIKSTSSSKGLKNERCFTLPF